MVVAVVVVQALLVQQALLTPLAPLAVLVKLARPVLPVVVVSHPLGAAPGSQEEVVGTTYQSSPPWISQGHL